MKRKKFVCSGSESLPVDIGWAGVQQYAGVCFVLRRQCGRLFLEPL